MAWSTRQLADLTGTTVRTLRHYHDVGLLEEPRRRADGRKQYDVAHLVRLLRIRRLVDIGFTLQQIAQVGDADRHPREALRGLDAHLARTLDRLGDVGAEVSHVLLREAATGATTGLRPTAARTVDTGSRPRSRSA